MKYTFAILLSIFFAFTVCGQSCDVEGVKHYNFDDIKAFLDEAGCKSCHANGNIQGGWKYDLYADFLTSGACGQNMIVHGDASKSYFFSILNNTIDASCVPTNGEVHRVQAHKLNQIESWINFGAPEGCLPLYNDVKSYFDAAHCDNCHVQNINSWSYASYYDLVGPGVDSNCGDAQNVVPGHVEFSLLYDKIDNNGMVQCGEEMNGLSVDEVNKIRDWINGGAPVEAAALPVELSDFDLSNDNGKVVLNWVTEIEVATDRFVVQRSTDGRNFNNIGLILAAGTSTSTTYYQYEDPNPVVGKTYYRLKIEDLDGSYSFSHIKLITIDYEVAFLKLYPNPVRNGERIIVEWFSKGFQESTYLHIVDIQGTYIHRKIIYEGTNYVRLPDLLEGVYYIAIDDYFGGQLLERLVIID